MATGFDDAEYCLACGSRAGGEARRVRVCGTCGGSLGRTRADAPTMPDATLVQRREVGGAPPAAEHADDATPVAAAPAANPPDERGDQWQRLRGSLGERFDVEAVIGAGGMGRVYRAWDHVLARRVAIKAVKPDLGAGAEWLERLRREARITARLAHPDIVQVFEVLEAGDELLVVLEYVDGEDLSRALRRDRLGLRERVAIMARVCHAVGHAHASGVVHRDIKPANVMLLADGRVKVMDFGIAGLDEERRADGAGEIAGSPPYMAPELLRGESAGDALSDIYALGVSLYVCLTGRLPYRDGADGGLLARVQAGAAPPPSTVRPGVDADIEAVCLRAMAVDAGARHATAFDLARDLEAWLAGLPVSARRYRFGEQVYRALGRRPRSVLLAVVLACALFGGIFASADHVHTVSEATILNELEDKLRNISFALGTLTPAEALQAPGGRLDAAVSRLTAFNDEIRDVYLVRADADGFVVTAAWHEGEAGGGSAQPRGHDTWGDGQRVTNVTAASFMAQALRGAVPIQHEYDADAEVDREWDQRLLGYTALHGSAGGGVVVVELTSHAVADAFGRIEDAFRITILLAAASTATLLVAVASALVLSWRNGA